jgi:ubiquinone/menaquinone biosynthesis C-methylase UbiE
MTANRSGPRLQVGCGRDILPGWVNADVERIPGTVRADVACLPFRDGTFGEVLASHVLEHIPDAKGAITELARVLRSGGTLEIRAPHYRHENAFNDLEHVHFFTPRSLDYFTEGSGKYRHRYPPLFATIRVEEVREHRAFPYVPRLLRYFPRIDTRFRETFGFASELRFYCVKR